MSSGRRSHVEEPAASSRLGSLPFKVFFPVTIQFCVARTVSSPGLSRAAGRYWCGCRQNCHAARTGMLSCNRYEESMLERKSETKARGDRLEATSALSLSVVCAPSPLRMDIAHNLMHHLELFSHCSHSPSHNCQRAASRAPRPLASSRVWCTARQALSRSVHAGTHYVLLLLLLLRQDLEGANSRRDQRHRSRCSSREVSLRKVRKIIARHCIVPA